MSELWIGAWSVLTAAGGTVALNAGVVTFTPTAFHCGAAAVISFGARTSTTVFTPSVVRKLWFDCALGAALRKNRPQRTFFVWPPELGVVE